MEKGNLYLDRGAEGPGFGRLLLSPQVDTGEAASYHPSPKAPETSRPGPGVSQR